MTQHTTQDSQSELDFKREIVLTLQHTPAEYPVYTILAEEMTKRISPIIEAYVTTRVKEAERLARLKELTFYEKQLRNGNFNLADCIESMVNDIETLTTTTNGKEE